ncbi:MAG: tRNA 4-thiouridine(8) synthase ThiI [Ruminococcaceae bacterium]|nr:tRNA 4-thiouridine(8) synthase ThiI [Oscillospiraceae bacterium]
MKEILLCKYGEIVLKGANRRYFEDSLCKTLRFRAKHYGNFKIDRSQSTLVIEPLDEFADIDGMFETASKVFGIVGISRCAVCEKDMGAIEQTIKEYIPPFLEGKKSFKVEAKRSDKRFPLDSMQICAQAGGYVLESVKGIRVDVHNPEVVVHVEIREFAAYIHAGQFKGAGGMPVGTNGKALLLLSGGIDSPVAGYMIAKRGVMLEAVHFESFPYTSELAREKVFQLAREVAQYAGSFNVHVVSLTHIQEELVKACEEDYFTLLLRRYMMAIADRLAHKLGCGGLITGESLGQVASQTIQAIGVTDPLATLPVFRPCIGMDKEEIVQVARKIGTFQTSIQPYEDCCTVFTPKHPRTRPELAKVLEQEQKLDFEALVQEALDGAYTVRIRAEF